MQKMPKIIGVTHIFIYQVPIFNYFSISLQKGKSVDTPPLPSPPLPQDHGRKKQALSNEHIISILKGRMITIA